MLHFDIDWSGLRGFADDYSATDKQVHLAMNRALRRTEATLRRMSIKGLRRELALREVSSLRRRIKSLSAKMIGKPHIRSTWKNVGLWYGLNDLPVSSFQGKPKSTASGAEFKGKNYDGGFIGKHKKKNKNTIFKRVGESRLPISEQLYEVEDKAIAYIEDEIFSKLEDIFWDHFMRDIYARTVLGIGAR